MENINLPPFYSGQRVVCIVNQSQNFVTKGQEFIVIGVKKFCCKWTIDVGLINIKMSVICKDCGHREITHIAWLKADLFIPIDESFEVIEYCEVLGKEKPLISAN